MKRTFFLVLSLVLSTSIYSSTISSIEVKTSSKLKGEIHGSFTLRKPITNAVVKNFYAPLNGKTNFSLEKPMLIGPMDYRIDFISQNNLPNLKPFKASIVGRLKIKSGKIRRDDLYINDLESGIKVSCENVIEHEIVRDNNEDKLVIDLTKFENLSSCSGSDQVEFSPQSIGMRKVDDGANFFTPDEDIVLGKQFATEFEKENKAAILSESHPMTKYLQKKMELVASRSDNPSIKPRVRVINADVLNAFAVPGGYVYVYRGLLERAPSEAALMGVLGHEWAHVVARHGTRGMTSSLKLIYGSIIAYYALNIAAELSRDQLKALALQALGVTTVIGAQLAVLYKSRKNELEADRLGTQYSLLSGYHPIGLGDMFEEFKKNNDMIKLETLFSTHPSHDERIEQNHMLCSLFYPAKENYVTTTNEFLSLVGLFNDIPLPPKSVSEKVANSFVKGFESIQENEIMKRTEDFMKKTMSEKK